MASQAASTWVSQQALDFQNAKLKTDALAIAPYFGGYLGTPAQQTLVQSMTLDALFTELQTVAVPEAIGWINVFDSANRDPRMGALYKTYLDAWETFIEQNPASW